MKRLVICSLLFLFFFIQFSFAQGGVGVGISSMYITLTASIGRPVSSTVGIINPSKYDAKVKLTFDCVTCTKDAKIFGIKIGEIIEDPYQVLSLDRDEVYVRAFTTGDGLPITLTVNPKLIWIKKLRIYTPESINFYLRLINKRYKNYFDIPYPALLVGTHKIQGTLTAEVIWSSFGTLGVRPAVGASTWITLIGMPVGSLILLIVGIILIIVAIFRKRIVKILPKKLKEKLGKLKRKRKK